MDDAARLAAERARLLGLNVSDAHVLRVGHNVLVHLRPSPVLARVAHASGTSRDARAHMRNEVGVARFLADRGAPVAPPATSIDPGPHEIGRTVVSYWTYVEAQGAIDPLGAGRALARCHAVGHDADLVLEAAGGDPPTEALRIFAELLARGVVDPARGRRLARSAAHELEAVAALGLRKQIVHGDAHLENPLAGPRGPLWNDWEDTFVGPVQWDLACLVATAQVTGAGRARAESALRGYGIDRLDPEVDVFVRLRAFQVATWLLTMAARDRSMIERAEPWLGYVENRRRHAPLILTRFWQRARRGLGP